MNEELIEQVARAIELALARDVERDVYASETCIGERRCIAASLLPIIAAEREDAARRALEAAHTATASERLQDETGDATDISYQCAVEHCSDAIRVIDPAQFREAGNG